MDLISILIPYDNRDEMTIMTLWLQEDFQTYDSLHFYDPEKWQQIADFATGLLLKRSIRNLGRSSL